MKKILFILAVLVFNIGALLLIYTTYPISDLRGKGTERLKNPGNVVLVIQKEKECIPISLYLYDDNTYELFTDYESCKLFQECISRLHYTKSIKGKYNYDLTKILDNSVDYSNTIESKEIDYELLTFANSSLGDKYNHNYVVKKNQTNEYLEELLKSIDVDLNKCAIPEYN